MIILAKQFPRACETGTHFPERGACCMELLIFVPTIGLLAVYIAYKEWLNIIHRQWAAELDLFKRRLVAYEQLKSAVSPIRAAGAVTGTAADSFAEAMANMQFLFDEEIELLVGNIYAALMRKHALDLLLGKVAAEDRDPNDQALIEKAQRKSHELSGRITNGIYKDMPEQIERFMRPRSLLRMPRRGSSPRPALTARAYTQRSQAPSCGSTPTTLPLDPGTGQSGDALA